MSKTYAVNTVFSIIDKASSQMSRITGNLSRQMMAAEARFTGYGNALSKSVTRGFAAAVTATSVALKQAIPLGMEFEQNIGGTEAVFGKYAQSIKKYSEYSYKTMGLSMSEYMATANKMGSLFQGSGLTQERAMELTSAAMQRAADVASVMGIDTKSAMESIAGAAKGNFTMMDNLGVAMNATTLSAYALEKGINFKWNTATNAQKAELAMKMFFEKTSDYAGNFKNESEKTLSGSFSSMKKSFENILTKMSMGSKMETSMEVLMGRLKTSVITYLNNIRPAIVSIINQFPDLVRDVFKETESIITATMKEIRSPFGEILTWGLRVVKILWKIRYVVLSIALIVMAYRGVMNTIYATEKAIHGLNVVIAFAKGIHIAHQAAIYGSVYALNAEGASGIAASLGLKAYALGAKIATAAQWLFNAALAANPIILVISGIILLTGLIVVLIGKWEKVTSAVDGFFDRIRNMKGFGGYLLKVLVTPLEAVWRVIRGIFDTINAFKVGGFLAGIKMLGLSILQFIAAPIQGLLQMLSFIPGLGNINKGINEWFESTRANILAGGATENAGALPASEESPEEISMAAPTQTAAMANSYTREESITTNKIEIGLSDGLSVKNGAMAAPAFTLLAGR